MPFQDVYKRQPPDRLCRQAAGAEDLVAVAGAGHREVQAGSHTPARAIELCKIRFAANARFNFAK